MLRATLDVWGDHYTDGFCVSAVVGAQRFYQEHDLGPWYARWWRAITTPRVMRRLLRDNILKSLATTLSSRTDLLALAQGRHVRTLHVHWSAIGVEVVDSGPALTRYDPYQLAQMIAASIPPNARLLYWPKTHTAELTLLGEASMHEKMNAARFGTEPQQHALLAAIRAHAPAASLVCLLQNPQPVGGVFFDHAPPQWLICGALESSSC